MVKMASMLNQISNIPDRGSHNCDSSYFMPEMNLKFSTLVREVGKNTSMQIS